MSFEKFIAGRLKGQDTNNSFTKPIINIAIWGIALGVMVMFITLGIVKGFQHTVSSKVMNFNSHLQITKISQSDSYESKPLPNDYEFITNPQTPGIKHIQGFALKAGIVKADQDIHGIILKGITKDYNQEYLKSCLEQGETLNISDSSHIREILISSKLANILNKKLGDKFTLYFISQKKEGGSFQQRKYPFTIKGIYNTGLSEDFDNRFMICDIHYIQKLNYWEENTVGGFEIILDNPTPSFWKAINEFDADLGLVLNGQYNHLDETKEIFFDNNYQELQQLRVETVEERFPQIFDWLNLFDTHIVIIVLIIIIISVINMSAVLLIQLIEKTAFIGLLKSMGATSKKIQKIFLYQSLFLIGRGLLFGNILGLTLCGLQYFFRIVPLDESVYYISFIPIKFDWFLIILVNIVSILSCFLVLMIPSRVIAKISPSKSIRFN